MDIQFDLSHVKAVAVAWAEEQVAAANLEAYRQWSAPNGIAEGWLNEARRNRELGVPCRPKPEPPYRLKIVVQPDGWPDVEKGDERIAPPIPDLEVLPAGGVGRIVGGGPYYQALPGDTAKDGDVITVGGERFRRLKRFFYDYWEKL